MLAGKRGHQACFRRYFITLPYLTLIAYKKLSHRLETASAMYFIVAKSLSIAIRTYSSNFCGGLRKMHLFCNRMRIGRSRSSKVVDFGTNRKGVCDFLLLYDDTINLIMCLRVVFCFGGFKFLIVLRGLIWAE